MTILNVTKLKKLLKLCNFDKKKGEDKWHRNYRKDSYV